MKNNKSGLAGRMNDFEFEVVKSEKKTEKEQKKPPGKNTHR